MTNLMDENLDRIPVDIDITQGLINDDEPNNNINKDTNLPKKPKGWGRRHTLAILGFWGFAMAYAMRFNLAIAIVAMAKTPPQPISPIISKFPVTLSINSTEETDPLETNIEEEQCIMQSESLNKTNTSGFESEGEFDWDEGDQGLILGSFFWGYIVAQIPGGFIAKRFGGKWALGIGIFVTGFMTLLTPLAARTNIFMLVYVRVVEGFAQGVIFPSMQTILASWSPPNERSYLSAITYSGAQFGAAVTMITSGYLIESEGGWPAVFHFTGGLAIIWFAFWSTFVYNTPEDHPNISEEEKNYIQKSLGEQSSKESVPTPWKKIITSGPVWAIIIAQFGHTWGFYTLLMELPTYLKTVLQFEIKQDSWLSATPELFMWAFANLITYAADYCISKNWAKTITVRKTCHAISEIGAALAVLGASFMGCNRTAAVVFLTFAVGISGAVCASYTPNQVDIACNHAGIIMGITNTISNFAGFGSAMVVGALTRHHSTVGSWRYVFCITAGLYLADTVVYLALASSDEQSWNRKATLSNDDAVLNSESEADDKPPGCDSCEVVRDSSNTQTRLVSPPSN